MATARQQLTLEQFRRLPAEEPALEYWRGAVTQKVSPKGPHGALQLGLGRRVDNFAVPRRLARAFTETRVTFAGESTVPDLVVYRWVRIPRDDRGEVAEDFTTAPDVAVEILSPGQSRRDLVERCRWYAAHGVPLVILADSQRRAVRLFRPDADSGDLRGADLLDLGAVVPGLSSPLTISLPLSGRTRREDGSWWPVARESRTAVTSADGVPSQHQVDQIVERLDRRFGLDVVWLFGSNARGTSTSSSDVDLAALFRRTPEPDDVLAMAAELETVAGRPVDLIDLDRASPILVMQVLRTGRLLAERSPSRRQCLIAAAPGRYEDLLSVRRPIERAILERARRGRS